jgi:YjbE family integral membrane protein
MNEIAMLFLEIMLINLVLSGDNAVVIALASQKLPPNRRRQAVWWGSFGAISLRLLLTIIAVQVLDIPYIQATGAFLLFYIAIKLMMTGGHDKQPIREAASLGEAVRTIILADFIMSLDNVLAVAAIAKGNVGMIIVGIGLSIPLIIWGSSIIIKLLDRFPVLTYLGAALLGLTAGEMLLHDREVGAVLIAVLERTHRIIPFICAGMVIIAGLLRPYVFQRKHR